MVALSPVRPALAPSRRAAEPREWPAAAAWLALVTTAIATGTWLIDGPAVQLRAAPLYGRWDWHPGVALAPAVMVAVVGVVWLPGVLGRCRWRDVPAVSGAAAVVWALALAASDGWDAVTAPLVTRHEYEPFAAGIDRLGPYLGSYVDRLAERPIHVQGHPPGPVVVAWVLDRVGLGGAGWLAVLVLLAWGIAVAAALVAARAVAGEAAARRAAPALVLLPAAVWAGTSFDAVFAALVAVAIAALALAATRGSVPWALGAGVVAGCALLSSYGAVVALLPGVAVALVLRCPARAWAAAAIGLVGPLLVAAAAGFWWFDGLAATRDRYWDGIGADRPALYLTLLGNPAALALAVGPAVAVGLRAQLRRPPTPAPAGPPVDRLPTNVRALEALLPPAALGVNVGPAVAAGRWSRLWRPPTLAAAGPPVDRLPAGVREPATLPPTTLGVNVGPAVAAGPWSRLRRRSASAPAGAPVDRLRANVRAPEAWLPLAALVAVSAADLSQMSRGEVERIWLPFVPFLALAAPGGRRGWLAAQAGVALVVQSTLISAW